MQRGEPGMAKNSEQGHWLEEGIDKKRWVSTNEVSHNAKISGKDPDMRFRVSNRRITREEIK